MILATSLLLVVGMLGRDTRGADLPPAKQALFLARVIAYDGNLKTRAGPSVDIAILVKKGDKASEQMSEGLLSAFKALEGAKLSGLNVRVLRVFFPGRAELDKTIESEGIDTLYVCSGLDAHLAEIKSVTHARKVMTVASQEGHLKSGLTLGVFEIGGKNTILVNLEASREEGVSFGPDLLRLATVVR
jgi:hypothetical protein